MRVLHLYAGNLYGGIETLLVTLARHRDLYPDMEPHFGLCFEGRLSKELKETGAPVHMLGQVRFSRPWTVWRARRNLAALLKKEKPDVAICHECWPHTLFALAVRAGRLPLVFWAHDAHSGAHWLERRARRTPPDSVIANSRFTQSTLPKLFSVVPGEIVYCPVPPPPDFDRSLVRRQVRRELQTPENAVVLIQASRLERWKGQTLLLQALASLKTVPDWVCWIAGGAQRPQETTYLAELRAMADRLGLAERIRFLGQRTDVPQLLAAADIHCQPNLGPEPFGIAFVEALYAGLPVVTTAIGGALEIVDESCGILVPPGDVNALARTLRQLMEDEPLRKKLAEAAPARAAALCDLETRMNALGSLLASTGYAGCSR